jgi:hypothetical protein
MVRNNKLVAVNRWKNVREKECAAFAPAEIVRVEKAALCGFLAGDGSVKIREVGANLRYDINFFPDDDVMLHSYLSFFEKVYGKIPVVRLRKNFYHVEISSVSVGKGITSMAFFGLYTWRLPLMRTKAEKAAWLRAFFSAEGYVGKKSVRVQTVNENGMLAVSKMLDEFDIAHGFYAFRPKNPCHSKVYIVTITRENERAKYAKEIGFWHARKTAKLEKTLALKGTA